jgi:hypothetical protein
VDLLRAEGAEASAADLECGHFAAWLTCFLLAANAAPTLDCGSSAITLGFGCNGLDGYDLLAAIAHLPEIIEPATNGTPITRELSDVRMVDQAKLATVDPRTYDGPLRLDADGPLWSRFSFRPGLRLHAQTRHQRRLTSAGSTTP